MSAGNDFYWIELLVILLWVADCCYLFHCLLLDLNGAYIFSGLPLAERLLFTSEICFLVVGGFFVIGLSDRCCRAHILC